jgi:hypothetical protein
LDKVEGQGQLEIWSLFHHKTPLPDLHKVQYRLIQRNGLQLQGNRLIGFDHHYSLGSDIAHNHSSSSPTNHAAPAGITKHFGNQGSPGSTKSVTEVHRSVCCCGVEDVVSGEMFHRKTLDIG